MNQYNRVIPFGPRFQIRLRVKSSYLSSKRPSSIEQAISHYSLNCHFGSWFVSFHVYLKIFLVFKYVVSRPQYELKLSDEAVRWALTSNTKFVSKPVRMNAYLFGISISKYFLTMHSSWFQACWLNVECFHRFSNKVFVKPFDIWLANNQPMRVRVWRRSWGATLVKVKVAFAASKFWL